jgi:hypothetical protein
LTTPALAVIVVMPDARAKAVPRFVVSLVIVTTLRFEELAVAERVLSAAASDSPDRIVQSWRIGVGPFLKRVPFPGARFAPFRRRLDCSQWAARAHEPKDSPL